MSKTLMKSLKMDLPALADMIRSKGRGNDTMLAHITPREAALLKRRGGSGTTNPDTGLPEFDDGFDAGSFDIGFGPGQYSAPATPAATGGTTFTPQQAEYFGYSDSPPAGGRYSGQNIVLPGEGGDISAYQPDLPGSQPFLQAGPDAKTYGFSPSNIVPPTIQSTPTPGELQALQAGGPQDLTAQAPTTPGAPKTEQQSMLEKLGLQPKDLTRMGLGALLTGGLAATNISRSRQAQQQANQAQAQQQALATPYQQQGQQLVAQAQAGQLSPQSTAAYQAAQARINQGIAQRGGVGVQQASNDLANIYQSLLANQYQLGNTIMNIGDQYALGAIKTGLQANTAVNQANQNFYQALAQMAAPFLMGQAPVYQVSGRTA